MYFRQDGQIVSDNVNIEKFSFGGGNLSNTYIWIYIILIITALIGGYLFFKSKNTKSDNSGFQKFGYKFY